MTTDVQAVVANEMPLPFGVRAGSGASLPGLNPNALQSIGVDPQSILEKADPKAISPQWNRVKDPNDLKQAGWGVILPAGISPDIVTALKPLLDRRKEQAGDLYKEFTEYPFRPVGA